MKKLYKLLVLIIILILTCLYNIDFIKFKLKGANYLVRQSDKDDIYSNLILIKNNNTCKLLLKIKKDKFYIEPKYTNQIIVNEAIFNNLQ